MFREFRKSILAELRSLVEWCFVKVAPKRVTSSQCAYSIFYIWCLVLDYAAIMQFVNAFE